MRKSNSTNHHLLVMIVPLMLTVVGCGSGKLSRSKAEKLIAASMETAKADRGNPETTIRDNTVDRYNAQKAIEQGTGVNGSVLATLEVELELAHQVSSNSLRGRNICAARANGYQYKQEMLVRAFKELGLVERQQPREVYIPYNLGSRFDSHRELDPQCATTILPFGTVVLTAEGKKIATEWKCVHFVDNMYTMAGDRCNVPVTSGLNVQVNGIQLQNARAVAEYTLTYVPNRIGKQLVKNGIGPKTLKEGINSQATFQLYVDGWRITSR